MTGFETVMMWVIAPVIAALAGGWGGWIFGRKKQRIDEIDAATGTFNKIIEQLRKEVEVLIAERAHNRELIEKQSEQIKNLTEEVRKVSAEVERLRITQKEMGGLKRKVEKYEKLLTEHNIDF